VVLFGENHISSGGESGEVGNPGTLGMTKKERIVVKRGRLLKEGQLHNSNPKCPLWV
jgi:hypothetical protein